MGVSLRKNKLFTFGIILLIALSYLITARLGLMVAIQPGYATAFWPPSGIAVASVLLFGNGVWPAILIGSFIANAMTTVAPMEEVILVSFGIASFSTIQALITGHFINTYANGMNFFDHHKSVFKFIMSTFGGCLIASTGAGFLLFIAGIIHSDQILHTWITWLIGDSTGIFIFTPWIISLKKTFDWEELRSQFFELFQICVWIVLISIFCFLTIKDNYPIAYMLIPFLIWAIFRFEPWVCSSLILVISCIAIWGTANHLGIFHQDSVNYSLILLQAFLGVYSTGSLFMISVLNELDQAFIKLEEYNLLLKNQIESKPATAIKDKTSPIEKLLANSPNHNTREKIDFNGLVTGFTNLVYLEWQQQNKDTTSIYLEKVLDRNLGEVELIPVDFSKAFAIILNQAFEAVKSSDHPEITVQTRDLGDKVAVIIRDNGYTSKENETEYLKCYELIVKKQGGEIKHSKVEDGFEEFSLILPK